MTAAEFWLLVLCVIAASVSYWLGRIDGYWRRAEEDRARQLEESGAPNV